MLAGPVRNTSMLHTEETNTQLITLLLRNDSAHSLKRAFIDCISEPDRASVMTLIKNGLLPVLMKLSQFTCHFLIKLMLPFARNILGLPKTLKIYISKQE